MTTKISCLNDGFVQLIDYMGSDASICNAARVSYGNHKTDQEKIQEIRSDEMYKSGNGDIPDAMCLELYENKQKDKDRNLIRYLMRHRHTTPFEMVSFVFLVRCPIHVTRQWMRHRTWSYNEYSTRYKPAIDSFETTKPDAWRSQSSNNKQGSGEYLTEWPEGLPQWKTEDTVGEYLTNIESDHLANSKQHYNERLKLGVAREQARKDLPLSTYTEFYAKVDLHNLFHFLSLRLDSHAQLEIRTYAEAISQLIKLIIPTSYEAFEDYRLNGAYFSSQEISLLRSIINSDGAPLGLFDKPDSLSDREWKEFKQKLS